MDRRTISVTIFATLLGIGAPAFVTALTLAEGSPYHDVIFAAGAGAALIGVVGLASLLLLPSKAKDDRPETSSIYNVTNTGPGFALGHGTIQVGRPRFELTEELLDEIAARLDPARPVALFWRESGRTPKLIPRLRQGMTARGFKISAENSFGEIPGVHFEEPIMIGASGLSFTGVTIMAGMQTLGVDASVV